MFANITDLRALASNVDQQNNIPDFYCKCAMLLLLPLTQTGDWFTPI